VNIFSTRLSELSPALPADAARRHEVHKRIANKRRQKCVSNVIRLFRIIFKYYEEYLHTRTRGSFLSGVFFFDHKTNIYILTIFFFCAVVIFTVCDLCVASSELRFLLFYFTVDKRTHVLHKCSVLYRQNFNLLYFASVKR